MALTRSYAQGLPGLCLRLIGKLGKVVIYDTYHRKGYVRSYFIPTQANTPGQLRSQAYWRQAVADWHLLPAEQRAAYNALASGKPYTGFNLWMRLEMEKHY